MRTLEPRLATRSPLVKLVCFTPVELAGVTASWCEPLAEEESPSTVLYLHGGAYVMGSVELYREIIARLVLDARCRVLGVDYRLGPETPFPGAHDDCFEVYRALLESGVDPRRLAVVGDSAGGSLALATLCRARDASLPMPAAAVLFSPWVDPGADDGSLSANEDDDVIGRPFLQMGIDGYMDGQDLNDPRLAPLHADLTGLPPLLVQVGDAEILLDQDRELAPRARAAGVEVDLKVYEDLFHSFQNLTTTLPRCESAVADSTAFLRSRLELSQSEPRADPVLG